MKILVFGNSGSGKNTYSQSMAAQHGLVHLDLDSIVWELHQTAIQRPQAEILMSLEAFISSNDSWIIEGCYGDLVQAASAHCTKLVFLNPGMDVCLANNLRRPWEPHKYASLAQQNSMLANLQAWVSGYYERDDAWSYKAHRQVFDAFSGTKVEHTDISAYAVQPVDPTDRLLVALTGVGGAGAL
jgi:adenylate kinase family enzyme